MRVIVTRPCQVAAVCTRDVIIIYGMLSPLLVPMTGCPSLPTYPNPPVQYPRPLFLSPVQGALSINNSMQVDLTHEWHDLGGCSTDVVRDYVRQGDPVGCWHPLSPRGRAGPM